MKDLNGTPVEVGARVAVARSYGYSVSLFLGTVLDVYQDKNLDDKVKVAYDRPDTGYSSIPEKPQSLGLDKVVVLVDNGAPTA